MYFCYSLFSLKYRIFFCFAHIIIVTIRPRHATHVHSFIIYFGKAWRRLGDGVWRRLGDGVWRRGNAWRRLGDGVWRRGNAWRRSD